MGRVITACAAESKTCKIIAGLDVHSNQEFSYPVFSKLEEASVSVDAVVDFSNPVLLSSLLAYGIKTKTPLVLCTTGYDKNQQFTIQEAASQIPIFYSGNMSIGINLLIELSKMAAKALGTGFDVEIIEKHHNQKIDAPSGTALMIADGISTALQKDMRYVYDRHSQRKKRESDEIGIHSVRGGTIVGEHEVIFAGPHEVLTLSHSAESKEIFALGALHAAEFLCCKANGIYTMKNLLNSEVAK